jgi:hypothetical protein
MTQNLIEMIQAGVRKWVTPIVTSGGAGDAGKPVVLDATGKLDSSVMPNGIGAETQSITTSEDIADGAYVNVYSNTGTITARNANATAATARPANGFVKAGTTSGSTAIVYALNGALNDHLSTLTTGSVYYLGKSAGAITTDISGYTTGDLIQQIGVAWNTTTLVHDCENASAIA